MEITVKRDVKIDSDKVLKLLSSHIESSNKSGVKLLYVNSSLLKDAYDLIKYFVAVYDLLYMELLHLEICLKQLQVLRLKVFLLLS